MSREALTRHTRQLLTTIANTNRTVGTMLGARGDPRTAAKGCRTERSTSPSRDPRATASAPSFPAVSRCGFWRRERLCRQGPFRRTPGVAAVEERTGGYIAEQHHRQRSCSAPPAVWLSSGDRRRALRGAKLGAHAVVEGVGDHGCEYMTGGRVVIPRTDWPQLRRRHVGGVASRLRPGEQPSGESQHRDGGARAARRRRPRLAVRDPHRPRRGNGFSCRTTNLGRLDRTGR